MAGNHSFFHISIADAELPALHKNNKLLILPALPTMSYIEKTLSSEESIYSIFKLHWMAWMRFVGWFLLAIPTFGLTLLVAGYEYLRLKSIEQAVTNKRIIFKKGIISRHSEEMRLSSVETVEIRQSIWGRIFGYATIAVTGHGVSDVQLNWMAQPLEVKRAIEDALHQR